MAPRPLSGGLASYGICQAFAPLPARVRVVGYCGVSCDSDWFLSVSVGASYEVKRATCRVTRKSQPCALALLLIVIAPGDQSFSVASCPRTGDKIDQNERAEEETQCQYD